MARVAETLGVGEDGFTLPTEDVLTGRGFVTGKSGSGKSNTASVLAEELLDAGLPLLIVDTDGEYYGLKQSYDLLHVGANDQCDAPVSVESAQRFATALVDESVPAILDLSGFPEDDGHEVLDAVVSHLFQAEGTHRTPFLLMVEEMHEFVPQSGTSELADTLIRVAKRGRKRGLGMMGLSQRPAAVDKDYITQCNWLVWHRLTWENDTDVVARILGKDAAERVQSLDAGEAILQADWEDESRRVQFRRKRTLDAGATPGLQDVDRTRKGGVDEALLSRLAGKEVSMDGRDDVDPSPVAETHTVDPQQQRDDGDEAPDDADGDAGDADREDADAGGDVEPETVGGGTAEHAGHEVQEPERTPPGPDDPTAGAVEESEPEPATGGGLGPLREPSAREREESREPRPKLPKRPKPERRERDPPPAREDDPLWEVGSLAVYLAARAVDWVVDGAKHVGHVAAHVTESLGDAVLRATQDDRPPKRGAARALGAVLIVAVLVVLATVALLVG
jgi:hypothetical protein